MSLLLKLIQLANRLNRRQLVNREIFQFFDKWMLLLGGEEGHLPGGGHGDIMHGFAACLGVALAFEFFENFLGTVNDWARDTSELRDMDAIAAIGSSRDDLAQEDNLTILLCDRNIHAADARQQLGYFDQLMVMGSEECACATAL